MKTAFDVPVLIAGGGPVGMTLALELARHGVRSIVVERNHDTTRHPKMDLTNGRSMELYRRLGIVDAIRSAGVPEDHVFDITWATSPSGHRLHTFPYPSAAQKRVITNQKNDGSGTAEPGIRISQIILEPILRDAMSESVLIDARFGWKFEQLSQDSEGVTATVRHTDTGETLEIRSAFLVGCDGGGSRVRRSIGIDLEGTENIARILMIHFKSKERDILNPWGIAYHLQTGLGSLVAQDDADTWTLQMPLPPGTVESTLEPADMLRSFVGRDFDFELLVANPWSPHLVIARHYIVGRVILAGDAAHQVIPTGGYGLNTGVGDACDLGWKLSAILHGWGGQALLDSYELERKQIAVQNRSASGRHFDVRIKIAEAFAVAEAAGPLDEIGPAGDERRAGLGAAIATLGNAENESWGIEHGYRYRESPVILEEGNLPPPFDPLACTPTTIPGSRLPHVVLADGRLLIDDLGPEFTLLVVGSSDTGDFANVAASLGIPVKIVRLEEERVLAVLERKLVLVRPDQHVAWRGDTPPDAASILRKVVGRSVPIAPSRNSQHSVA